MEILDLLNNHLLINALAAWAAAQVLKTILHAVTNKTLEWGRLIGDGGMPSGHSATVTSLAVTAGLEYGLESPLFAIAAVLAIECKQKWNTNRKLAILEIVGGIIMLVSGIGSMFI